MVFLPNNQQCSYTCASSQTYYVQIRKRELDEKKAILEKIKAGEDPRVSCAIEDEEAEAVPDLEIRVPKHKVKLIVGAGGERIKSIQRKSKTRIQVH